MSLAESVNESSFEQENTNRLKNSFVVATQVALDELQSNEPSKKELAGIVAQWVNIGIQYTAKNTEFNTKALPLRVHNLNVKNIFKDTHWFILFEMDMESQIENVENTETEALRCEVWNFDFENVSYLALTNCLFSFKEDIYSFSPQIALEHSDYGLL